MATNEVRSEEVLGQKWDRCLADTSMKFVTGAGVGVVFSFLFFKRRPWPVTLLAGIGLGMGYSNCQHDFQTPYIIHGKLVKETENGNDS
ncbi:MICOS complex subunit Mic10-like [Mercenaria mercenaria]|uniref:MICOS complex subunit Mic10-like n=1 Tax=Mercenaria mercenaria TaxID=6596 RepID=UPI001E1DDF31|nr:MICOS complex subunit Mic10-like [Mercenaria mercenaria]